MDKFLLGCLVTAVVIGVVNVCDAISYDKQIQSGKPFALQTDITKIYKGVGVN